MKQRRLRQWLATHIAVRLVVATVLLGLAVVMQVRAPERPAVQPVLLADRPDLRGQPRLLALERFVDRPWLTDVHFALDSLVVSAAVYLTGGVDSLFTPLYTLPIVAASTVQFRRGGLQMAGLNTILFVGVVVAQFLAARGVDRAAVRAGARRPAGAQRRAVHRRPERPWILRGGAAERLAGRARAARLRPGSRRPPRRSPTCRPSTSTSSTTC